MSLFETLISLVILAVLISGFSTVFNKNSSYELYNQLQADENLFYSNQKVNNSTNIIYVQK